MWYLYKQENSTYNLLRNFAVEQNCSGREISRIFKSILTVRRARKNQLRLTLFTLNVYSANAYTVFCGNEIGRLKSLFLSGSPLV